MRLDGKTAVVTGGSRGIGAAIVERFSAAGAKVFFTYKSNAEAAEALASKTGATAICCDQTDAESVKSAAESICAQSEKVDVLVNNAGITKDSYFLMMPDADWDGVLSTNLGGAYLWTKALSRKMFMQKSGSIIFISSVSGILGVAGQANYGASKGAMLSLSRTLAAEFGAKGVRVNSISPGFIDTDMTAKLPKDIARIQKERIPLKRFGRPDEIAQAALFLASDASSYITGQNIVADGGMTSCS